MRWQYYVLHGVSVDGIEGKIARLAAYIGLAPGFDAFLHAVIGLRLRLDVPHTLKDFGVDGAQRDKIGDMAIVDPGGRQSGGTAGDRALAIFDRAMEGTV